MVYCTRCGTKNPDDAEECSKCGAPLYSVEGGERRGRREEECFGTRRREPYRRVEQECFGIPRGGAIVGLVIGIIIVLAGAGLILQAVYPNMPQIPWWAFMVIFFGVMIVIGALYGMRRRY